jgi:hypothetical protein
MEPNSAGAADTHCCWAADAPVLDPGDDTGYAPADGAVRGGYILADADGGTRSVLLIGTGSEVQVALDARGLLQLHGIPVEWFAAQDLAYRDPVLPPGIRARVSVEAGVSSGWEKIIGDAAAASASNITASPLTTRPCTTSSVSLPPRMPPPRRQHLRRPERHSARRPPRHLCPGRRRSCRASS